METRQITCRFKSTLTWARQLTVVEVENEKNTEKQLGGCERPALGVEFKLRIAVGSLVLLGEKSDPAYNVGKAGIIAGSGRPGVEGTLRRAGYVS